MNRRKVGTMGLEEYIKCIAQNIHPSEEEIKDGKEKWTKLCGLLQKYSSISIDRIELVGSVEKKTAITGHIDFDCVVFVNSHNIEAALDDFENIFLHQTDLGEKDITKTPAKNPKTLQFQYQLVDFDFVVAEDLAAGKNEGQKAASKQSERVYQEFEQHGATDKQMFKLGSGLSKKAVEFVKTQSSFAHEIARLAKFWNKTIILEWLLDGNAKISGRSTIMETLGISAAKEEERNVASKEKSYLSAFRKVMVKIRDYGSIAIIFPETTKHQPPSSVLKRPYIVDPVNYHHNYLEGVPKEALEALSRFAVETLDRLEKVDKSSRCGNLERVDIFEVQPNLRDSKMALAPSDFLYETVSHKSRHIHLDINQSGRHLGQPRYVQDLHQIKEYFNILLQVATNNRLCTKHSSTNRQSASFYQMMAEKIKADVEEKMEKDFGRRVGGGLGGGFGGGFGCGGSSSSKRSDHASRMITITVPLLSDQPNIAIRISCDWQTK